MQNEHGETTLIDTGFFAGLVRHPVTLLVLFVTLMVIGTIAYVRIPMQMMPDGIVEPGLQVYAIHPGSSAEENEEQVARILEEEIRTIAGIGSISSTSSDEQVGISVRFDADTDMNLAKAEIRDRIERARPKLPSTVREIGIWSWSNSDMPVMFFAMLHPGDSPRTDFLIDTVIKRRLEAVDGIGRLGLWGVLDDSVRIELDEDRVRAAGLNLGALIARLSADNFAMPMGEVTDGGRRVLLRSDMRFKTKAEIAAYPLDGGLVLGDIGRVIDAKSVRDRLFRMDGTYAYFGEVQKEAQANVIEVCDRVKATLDELQADPRLEGEFKFLVFFNQGEFIQNSVGQLRHSALEGGLLSIVILFLFLPRVRLTMCMALAIPFSVLIAIAWVFFTGGTFNVLTMAGITLAMGMLVDNAVVVVENITRLRNKGLAPMDAAATGTREVALAVVLSTLTTVVVFLPMIFMSENPVLRIMFGALGLPLCVSLVASLVVAMIFLPAITARVLVPRHRYTEWLASKIAPIAAVPSQLLGLVLALLRMLSFAAVVLLHKLNRILLAGFSSLQGVAILLISGWLAREIFQGTQLGAQLIRLTASTSGGPLSGRLIPLALLALATLLLLFVVSIGPQRRYKDANASAARWTLLLAILAIAGWRANEVVQGSELAAQFASITGRASGGFLGAGLPAALATLAAAALLAVLLVAIGVRHWAARSNAVPAPPPRWRPAATGIVDGAVALNQSLLQWTLGNRFWASVVATLVLVSVVIPQMNMKMAAFGEDENSGRVRVEVELENNFTLKQAEAELAHYEQFFNERKLQYGFQHMACRFNKDGGRVDAYWDGQRTKEQHDLVIEDLRKHLQARPGHTLHIGGDDGDQARNRNLVIFRLVGPESEELSRLGQEAVRILEALPGLEDIKSPLATAPEQVRVVFDSDLASMMGVSPQNALQNVAWALRGWQLPRFQEPGREVPLIIEYDSERTAGLSTLRDLEVRAATSAVPLSTFSTIEYARASRTIERVDGKTSFQITARVDDPLRQRELSDLGLAALGGIEFPRGYSVMEDDLVSARQDSEMKEIYSALLLSIVLVFLLMGVLSESFLLPISILFTIPFAIVGALWTMYVTHTAMDSIGWIGVIILVGVVVNHGIVLIDRIHQLRNQGVDRTLSILEGSANRVRPVLMTALTTVVGLLPMALTEPPGEGIDYRALATCVAGGLSVSTISTLWVVPLAYAMLDDLRIAFAARVVRWRMGKLPAQIAEKPAPASV